MSITAFSFGEWLPDLPDLGNPGLTVAMNVLPYDRSYKPYLPLTPLSVAGPSRPMGAFYPSGASGSTFYDFVYAGFQTSLYTYNSAIGWTNRSSTVYSATTTWDFEQFDELIIATNGVDVPQRHTLGSSTNFTTLAISGTAPIAKCVGLINRFLFLGNLEASGGVTREHVVQWSALDDPTNWPTPNSATAIATQSSSQELIKALGPVHEIYGGDQHGLIYQAGGLTRVTYIGPPAVFQFDTLSRTHGAAFRNASISVNDVTYFISLRGFCMTDGVQILPIGDGKVDRYFLGRVSFSNSERIRAAHDAVKKLIIWCYPSTGATAGQPDSLLIYNYEEKRWTQSDQVSECVFTPPSALPLLGPHGFDSSNRICSFTGTPGTAILASGEVEPQPGGCALINGIKPIIASSGTAPTIGVQVGSRDDQATTVSYSSTTTPTARTGFADLRSDARYHRARVYIAGNFDKAQGLEIDATPTGGM